jgi:hypothetical protein
MHCMPFAGSAYTRSPRVVERVQRIGAAVELYVDPTDLMLCCPFDSVFELEPPPDVNSNPIAQIHQLLRYFRQLYGGGGRPGIGYIGFNGGNASAASRPSSKKPML